MTQEPMDKHRIELQRLVERFEDRLRLARAATVVADRLCGAVSDPIIRNAQEKRQLAGIAAWLQERGYTQHVATNGVKFNQMQPGTYSFRMNVQIKMITDKNEEKLVNIPVDAVIPYSSIKGLTAASTSDFVQRFLRLDFAVASKSSNSAFVPPDISVTAYFNIVLFFSASLYALPDSLTKDSIPETTLPIADAAKLAAVNCANTPFSAPKDSFAPLADLPAFEIEVFKASAACLEVTSPFDKRSFKLMVNCTR